MLGVITLFFIQLGYYVSRARPETHKLTVEEMTNQMIQDIEVGAEGTDIKCGVIGEVGCQSPITGGFIYIHLLMQGDMFYIIQA